MHEAVPHEVTRRPTPIRPVGALDIQIAQARGACHHAALAHAQACKARQTLEFAAHPWKRRAARVRGIVRRLCATLQGWLRRGV